MAPMAAPVYDEIATIAAGRDVTRGFVDGQHWLPPQDQVLLRAAGGNYEAYEDLLRDDRVHSTFAQRRSAVVAREWEVVPGGPRRRDRIAADSLRESLAHVDWDSVTDQMLYGVFYGYSVAEAIYGRDGASVVLDRIAVRNRRRFVFGVDCLPRLVTVAKPDGEELPPKKFWHFRCGGDNSDEPYGRGLANQLYWPVFFKRSQIRYWLIGLEKFAQPTPMGKYPRGQANQRDKLLAALKAMVVDGALAIPDDMDVSLIEAARTGTVDYGAFNDAMDRAITTVVLSQTMTTDDGSSRSQAEVHLEVRDEVVEADAWLIDDSFGSQVGAWLTEWNYPDAARPVVRRIMETPTRQGPRAMRDKLITEMGWRPTADYIEETYGVPVERSGAPAPADLAEGDAPVSALADNARDRLGPKVDEWLAPLREGLADAGSLDAYGEWIEDDAVDAVDAAPVADDLGAALAAAVAAGMLDAASPPIDLAESSEGARLPFREQIEFFRRKVSIPTRRWTDIWDEQHDAAFVVAGAARDDLLSDLRGAVDAAIADGETLAAFRSRFDDIIARHGWSYKGGRDWRTRVIYETNLASSYAAGRWRQLQAVRAARPYWRYRHSPASTDPREDHVAWDGMLLDANDPWWRTNFPPNGWGCKCFVEAVSEREAPNGADKAPPLDWEDRSAGERTVRVPEGVDPGFAYAPGRASARSKSALSRLARSIGQPAGIAAHGVADMLARPTVANAVEAAWSEWRRSDSGGSTSAFVLGTLPPKVLSALAAKSIRPATAAVLVTRKRLEQALPSDGDLDRLAAAISRPDAVLWDADDQNLAFVIVDGRDTLKIAIDVNYTETVWLQDTRMRVTANSVLTVGRVSRRDLRAANFQTLDGGSL